MRLQLALNVSDLDQEVDFYTKMFGTEPYKVKPGYANWDTTSSTWKSAATSHGYTSGKPAKSLRISRIRPAMSGIVSNPSVWESSGFTVQAKHRRACHCRTSRTSAPGPTS